MRFVNRTVARFKKLKKTDYILLFLLCMVSLTGGIAVALLDISLTNIFLKNQGLLSIGFDYLWVALLMMGVGRCVLILERRKGYGSAFYLFIACIILWLLLSGIKTDYQEMIANLLFIYKYGLLFLVAHACWAISERLIKSDFSSLRYTGVMAAQFCGYMIAGKIALSYQYNPFELLWGCFLSLVLFTVAVKLFSDIVSIPNETFVPKTGGVQDKTEQNLVNCIFGLAFCYTTARFLGDFYLYYMLMLHPEVVISSLAWLWIIFAGCGLCLSLLLWGWRFLFRYTLCFGMLLFSLSLTILALGIFISDSQFVYAGFLGMVLLGYFYYDRYLHFLPCFLLLGQGIRLKTMRLLLIEPVGIILTAALIMTVSTSILVLVILALAVVFTILFFVSRHIYSRLLMQMCYLRRWCPNPLMLTYRPLIQMLVQGVSDADEAHSLYCLSILLQGHHPKIRLYLTQALQHPSPKVRLFALEKLSDLFWDKKFYTVVQNIFQTDSNIEVQNYALHLMIRYEADLNDKQAYETYKVYLHNNELAGGACLGLLFTKHGYMDAVKAVGSWCSSPRSSIQHRALKVMRQKPCPEWMPWIKPFLFHSSEKITIAALRVVAQLPYPILLFGIFEALDNLKLRDIALDVLRSYGDRALPSIEKIITDDTNPFERRKVLIVFLGQQQSSAAKQMLLRVLFKVEPKLRMVIVRTIMAARMVWVHKDRREVIWLSIQNDVQQWYEMQQTLKDLCMPSDLNMQKILGRLEVAFQTEMNKLRQLILFQVLLLNTHSLVKRSCQLLLDSDTSAYAGAASCLQDLLPKKIYKTIQPVLLGEIPGLRKSENDAEAQSKAQSVLSKMILQTPKWMTPWLYVLALLGLSQMKSKNLMLVIEKALVSANWLILDTALWIVGHDVSDKQKAQELMLNVPTRYLVQHKFQEFLEGKRHD